MMSRMGAITLNLRRSRPMSGFTSTYPTGTTQNQGKTYRKHHVHKTRKGVPTKSGNRRGKMKTH